MAERDYPDTDPYQQPPLSSLVPGGNDPIAAYLQKHAGGSPLDVYQSAYRDWLGRPAGPNEAELHLGPRSVGYAQGGLAGGLGEIYNSPESIAYRNRTASGASTTTPGGTTGSGGTTTGALDLANPYTGGAAASIRAPRLIQRNGQWILTEHGHERPLQPNEVDAARAYVTQFAQQNPTGFIQPGSPGYDPAQALRNEDYPALTGGGAGGAGGAGGTTTGTQGATARFPATAYNFGGFNLARDQDVTRSAKDAFAYGAHLGEAAGAGNMWHTKEGAEQFANLYLKPYLESQGFKVLGIQGDRINIVTREDREAGNTAGSWFDFVVNAGGDPAKGENPMLAWQIQSGTGAEGNTGAGGGGTTGTGGGDPQAVFNSLIAGRAPSVANLVALEPQLIQNGMSLVWNANHTSADVRLPNGQIVDVLAGATAAGGPTGWQWLLPTTTGSAATTTTANVPGRATSAATTTDPGTMNPYAYQTLAGAPQQPSLADLVH